MKENIYYASPEGQKFQTKPHISVMLSQDFPGTWRVDLRWREDDSDVRIDALYNIADGLSSLNAFTEAFRIGDTLNLPVAEYEKEYLQRLQKTNGRPFREQRQGLQTLINSDKTQRFRTH